MITYSTQYTLKALNLVALLIMVSFLVSCNKDPVKPVKITYRQVLNFEVFDPDPSAQPHQTYGGGFAIYRIEVINNGEGSKTYIFDPKKIYIDNPSNSGWNVTWQHHVLGAPWRQEQETVEAGDIIEPLGCVVVGTNGTAGNFVHHLYHNSSYDDDHVIMLRIGPNTIPNPGTAFPHTLQQSCEGAPF